MAENAILEMSSPRRYRLVQWKRDMMEEEKKRNRGRNFFGGRAPRGRSKFRR